MPIRPSAAVLLAVAVFTVVLVAVLPAGPPAGDSAPAVTWTPPVSDPADPPPSPGSLTGPDEPAAEMRPAPSEASLEVLRTDATRPIRSGVRAAPAVVKAIYLTSWSAATPSRLAQAVDLITRTELNAVVIDIKDYSGKVVFETANPGVAAVGSVERRLDLAVLVRRLHENGIYVIVRIAVFQDQHLIKVRPELAVRNPAGRVWRDRKGLGWVDPASQEVWTYIVEVARAAADAGVDELNFDYIRFPSDGNLSGIRYPVFKAGTQTRREGLQQFFAYLTAELRDAGPVLSADLFGLATVREDDLGIGQVLEDALLHFDVVAPMVYPSHYARGFLGYGNPAAHPYEVIVYSLNRAVLRRQRLAKTLAALSAESERGGTHPLGQIRPWLQAFDLGAPYPPSAVRREMQAVLDAGLRSGWLLWSPSNRYQAAVFQRE